MAAPAWSVSSLSNITQTLDIHSGLAGLLAGKGTVWLDPGHCTLMPCTHLGRIQSLKRLLQTGRKTKRMPFLRNRSSLEFLLLPC